MQKDGTTLHHTKKTNSKQIEDLTVQPETIKLLAENKGGKPPDIGFDYDFLNLTPNPKRNKSISY